MYGGKDRDRGNSNLTHYPRFLLNLFLVFHLFLFVVWNNFIKCPSHICELLSEEGNWRWVCRKGEDTDRENSFSLKLVLLFKIFPQPISAIPVFLSKNWHNKTLWLRVYCFVFSPQRIDHVRPDMIKKNISSFPFVRKNIIWRNFHQ